MSLTVLLAPAGVAAATSAGRCLPVKAGGALEKKVSSTLGRRYAAVDMKAVRSRDYRRVWFVSGTVYYRLKPPKLYPVWAVSSLTSPTRIFAGNHLATVTSPGLGMLPHVSVSDDGVAESISCARRG